MDEDGDDDIYASDPQGRVHSPIAQQQQSAQLKSASEEVNGAISEEDEDGEEDESDSDIDIITEQKEEPRPSTARQPRLVAVKDEPLRPPSTDTLRRSPVANATKGTLRGAHVRSGASYPAQKTSDIDVDAKPIHDPSGKLLTEVDLDAGRVYELGIPKPLTKIFGITDFAEDDKAWRRPGTDLSDYFNYGFDEFTWANYCLKQKTLRQEVTQSKTQMQDMQGFLGMPGGGPSMGMGSVTGGADVSPEMMQMMSQMMAQGLNPQEMNPDAFMQQMMQSQGAAGGTMGQNYGSAQGYGQQGQNQQQMGYNYGGAGGGRNQGGRGRRNW